VFVVLSAVWFRDGLQYDGIAHPVDMTNSFHRSRLRQTVTLLTLLMGDNVCLACPHQNVALQCIVWHDGTVWINPEVVERSDEEIAGYETPFMGDDEDKRLVHRSASLVVKHDDNVLEKVTGGAAHCVDFSIGLFDGSRGILALP
jgi:peptide deformylase